MEKKNPCSTFHFHFTYFSSHTGLPTTAVIDGGRCVLHKSGAGCFIPIQPLQLNSCWLKLRLPRHTALSCPPTPTFPFPIKDGRVWKTANLPSKVSEVLLSAQQLCITRTEVSSCASFSPAALIFLRQSARFEADDTFWWLNAFYPLIKDARYTSNDQFKKKKKRCHGWIPRWSDRGHRAPGAWLPCTAEWLKTDTTSMLSNRAAPRLLSLIIHSISQSGFDQWLAL